MDKGIRPAALAKFVALLPTRTEVGDTVFRRNVMQHLMDEYSCTNPAAATHYNFAKLAVTASNPELVIGLGRAEGKNNGGRKKAIVVDAGAPEVAPEGPAVAPAEAAVEQAAEVEAKLYNVMKAKSGELVLLGVSLEVAEAAIAKAAKGKKAALVMA